MCTPITPILVAGLAIVATLCGPSSARADVLNLGPEKIVQAGTGDLEVFGYSVPSYAYWDNDELKDLIVGEGGGGYSSGKIRVYLNDGTAAEPQFADYSYVQSQGADLVVPVVPASACLGAFPRIVHFNDDDKKDLLVGLADGTVKQYLNVGSDTAPTFDGGALLKFGPAGSKTTINVGYRATVAVPDWDNNGVRDLVLGAYDGKIRVYLNEGTNAAPDFVSETILQGLTVPSGRSSPFVMDLDGDGKKDLLAGNTNGEILLYSNLGTDESPSFSTYSRVTADGVAIDLPGIPRSRPSVADWTGDGLPDLLVGASDGKIHLFQSVPEPGTLVLLVAGGLSVLLLGLLRRHRRK